MVQRDGEAYLEKIKNADLRNGGTEKPLWCTINACGYKQA